MRYDEAYEAFRLTKKRKAKLITVSHQGVLHFYPLEKQQQNASFWRKLSYSFPLGYVIQPIRRLLKGNRHYYRYPSFQGGATVYEKKFKGFMVFSKPIYKPGDTVKLKAWITTQSGKPINRPLLLRLTDRRFDIDSIIATIQPYRPGGYEYSFVLNDSLDLTLDQQHQLTLEELSSRKYNLDEYEGDLSEDEYAAKRTVLMRGSFFYEEYELASVTFHARTDKKTHTRGHMVAVYCKATDENDMAIMDGRVELLVRSFPNGAITFSHPETFLPDTLWRHAQAMESMGETKIALPDSIFPAASFDYEITCTFLNSNNEQRVVTLQQHFDNVSRQLQFDQQNDSLHITLSEAGKTNGAQARLYSFSGKDDTITNQLVQLPLSIHIDPFVARYEVAADSLLEIFRPEQESNMISCRSLRTRDSVIIQVINPKQLSFWYAIFAGNKLIRRGYGDSLLFVECSRTDRHYFVSLQYIYGNESRQENYTIPFQEKALTIQVNQPAQVYPGQQVTVDIDVTDAAGRPVQDADITAYAYTKKFNNARAPNIPYLGKTYKQRKRYNQFYPGVRDLDTGSVQLNWKLWSREMGLDSIEYYRFLYPNTIYPNTEAARHNTTQIAPFVVLDGELQPVHLLYIDEEPRFFSQAQQLPQYSFEVRPGKHALRIRTHDRLIYLDSIWAVPGKKTFLPSMPIPQLGHPPAKHARYTYQRREGPME
ncbi:hypothetical protein [Paraflavitalea speifideaquila]|uniref:hypothetical protein n=1 Tax=Paraflavitalea speifideaquila TaxID=3076558 RepID=UPI0028EFF5D8|nr:hypothetical protein [Paraflavitalea speifideiaquila]